MPTYNYTCPTHGTFTANASMKAYKDPQNCPTCEKPSPRDFITAPQISTRNPRPKANQSGGPKGRELKHAPGCSCSSCTGS